MLSLISWSEMCFKNFACGLLFQLFAKFPFILFRWRLGREPWWGMLILGISSFEDSYDEPLSISESSDDESSSLSLSDSPEDELYFLFLDPLFFFLGESYLLFFWPSLFFASILRWYLLFKVLSSGRVSDGTFLIWVIADSFPIITMQNKRNHLRLFFYK